MIFQRDISPHGKGHGPSFEQSPLGIRYGSSLESSLPKDALC